MPEPVDIEAVLAELQPWQRDFVDRIVRGERVLLCMPRRPHKAQVLGSGRTGGPTKEAH
jgi:hypothetical protein